MDNHSTLILTIGSAGAVIFLFAMISVALHQRWMQQKNYTLFLQQHLTKTHYQMLTDHLESVRRFRHDIANHIHTLNYLIKTEPNNTLFIEHKHTMEKPLSKLQEANFCSDIVIDAVIHNKVKECQKASIRPIISLQDFDNVTIKTIDLVALLYNLFDNAIEACQKITNTNKRFIEFTTHSHDNYLIIAIKNSIDSNEQLDPLLKSTKQSYWHGLGTSIIQQIVAKYDGNTQNEISNDFFKLTLYLNNHQSEAL